MRDGFRMTMIDTLNLNLTRRMRRQRLLYGNITVCLLYIPDFSQLLFFFAKTINKSLKLCNHGLI